MVMPYQEPTIESEARRLGMTVEQYVYTMMLKEYGTGTPRADLTTAYNQPAYTPPPAPPAGGESSYPPAAAAYAPAARGEPSYPPAASAYNPPTPAAAQPPQEPYEYRETSGLGKVGTQVGKDIEHYAAKQIRGQAERTQRAHAEELQKYNSLPDGVLKDLSHKNLLMLEDQYDQLEVSIQTGFSAPRALGTLFENPSLLPLWEQLKSETEGSLAYELPPLVGRLTPSKTGGPTGIGGMPTSKVPEGHEPQYLNYPEGPIITPVITPATADVGDVASVSGMVGGQFGGVAPGGAGQTFMGGQFGGPVADKPAEKAPQIAGPTTSGQGYETFAHLQEAKGEYPSVLSGGSPAQLTGALGKSGSEVNQVYNANVWQDSQLAVQRVDLGQGEQDYIVRRDAYGNVTSFTPT